MDRHRQQILNDRQLETLYSLAVNGKKTKSQLSQEFGVKYPAINGTMKILVDKDLVKITKKEPGAGKTKLFYELTNSGIDSLSRDQRITLERFWKIAFLVFDRKTNPNVTFSLQDYFSNYEKNVLGYDLQYTPTKWGILLQHFGILHKPKKSRTISILYALGVNGIISQKELFSYLRKSKEEIIMKSTNSQYEKSLDSTISQKLVIKFERNGGTKYRISILGLLFLLSFLDQNMPGVRTREQNDKFNKEIDQIFKKSKMIIPHISNNWDELNKIIRGENVLQFFKWMTSDYMPNSDSIQLNGVKELLITERIMGEANEKIISRESRIGFETISKLFKKGLYPEGQPSEVYNRLLFLSILSGFSVKNEEEFLRKMKGEKFSLELSIENSIANRISFEFFTYFIDWIVRERRTLERMKKNNTTVTEYYRRGVERWEKFHKNNREFRIWYHSWIEEIKKFEEKNLKLLREKDFLVV